MLVEYCKLAVWSALQEGDVTAIFPAARDVVRLQPFGLRRLLHVGERLRPDGDVSHCRRPLQRRIPQPHNLQCPLLECRRCAIIPLIWSWSQIFSFLIIPDPYLDPVKTGIPTPLEVHYDSGPGSKSGVGASPIWRFWIRICIQC